MMNKINEMIKSERYCKERFTFSLCIVLAGGLQEALRGVNKLAGWSGATTVQLRFK